MIDRALVVGLGSIGKRHLRLLRRALPEADIRVLRHSPCEDPIEFANGCFDRIEAARAFAPNLAIVANPAPFHLPVARALADVGSHLLLEKPLSDRVEGISGLISQCRRQQLQLQVGYNLRFMSTLQAFKQALGTRRIGRVLGVRCEIGQYLPSWRPNADYRNAVSAQRALGGGALLELSHELDMLRWVFGDVSWLSAWLGRQSSLDIDVEDSAMIQMGFEDGAVGQLGIDFLRRDTTRVCTAIGEEGSLRWDAVAGTVSLFDPRCKAWAVIETEPAQRDATYAAQIAAFLGAIETGESAEVAAQGGDGLEVVRLVEAARISDDENGRRVKIDGSLPC